MKHLAPRYDQAQVAHRALLKAGQEEEAHGLALGILIPYFDRRGMYRAWVEEWLPAIARSEDQRTRGNALGWLGKPRTNRAKRADELI